MALAASQATSECKSVQNEASVISSESLLVSVAGDDAKKFCRFFVSMPPPAAARKSVDAFYQNAKRGDSKAAVDQIIDLAQAPIPEGNQYYKLVSEVIKKNDLFVADCAAALFKKGTLKQQSKDGFIWCEVPPSSASMSLSVVFKDAFYSSVRIPSPYAFR
jgi:hypothetical protein